MNDIDLIKINFDENNLRFLNILMSFLMLGIALDISIKDFKQIILFPKSISIGLLCQYLLFPALTLAIIYLLNPPTTVALGMILVSACPSGNMANFLTHRAKGNVPLSITLNTITVLLASIFTPIVFKIWSSFLPSATEFSQTISIPMMSVVIIITQVILLPLLIGMLINYKFPDFTSKIRKPIATLSVILFFGFLIVAIIKNMDIAKNHLDKIFFIVLIHNAMALGMGYITAVIFGLNEQDRRTITIESGVHNTALGLILIFNFFGGIGGMALIAAWWGIWDLIAPTLLVEYWRRKS